MNTGSLGKSLAGGSVCCSGGAEAAVEAGLEAEAIATEDFEQAMRFITEE